MNPILLLCGIPSSLEAEILSECNNAIPGPSLLSLNALEEVSQYLKMEAPFKDRDYPAPHFLILYVGAGEFDPAHLQGLKKSYEFSKIPVILLAEGLEKPDLKQASEWLFAGIVQVPTEFEEKVNVILETIRYWSDIVKLPLI